MIIYKSSIDVLISMNEWLTIVYEQSSYFNL